MPPSAHCDDPDPACGPLRLVDDGAERRPAMHAAITNSFAFGGTNASLVLARVA